MDAACQVMSSGPPGRVVLGRKVAGLNGRRKTKTRQRLCTTCTDRQRSIVALITTVSAAPAERDTPSSVGLRLKHIVRRAEVFTNRPEARVSLRLPRTAG